MNHDKQARCNLIESPINRNEGLQCSQWNLEVCIGQPKLREGFISLLQGRADNGNTFLKH